MKKLSKILVLVLVISLLAISAGCGTQKTTENNDSEDKKVKDPMDYEGEIKVAAQNINETIILAHMAKILIEEHTGLDVTVNTDFTGSSVLHQAMTQDEIDVYPTWTGTQLTGVLRYEGPKMSGEDTWKYVKKHFEEKFDMTWMRPFGFNNTYIMAVRKETAEKYGLKKASDLDPYAEDWVLAGDDNFDVRSDAYPGWSKAYGIEFKKVLPMQYSIIYRAIDNKEVDVISAYATDSRIDKLNLVTLEDDKDFFPDYSGAYVVRGKVIRQFPRLKEVLEKISGQIENDEMRGLNAKYDIDGEEPEDIAREFLSKNGYID